MTPRKDKKEATKALGYKHAIAAFNVMFPAVKVKQYWPKGTNAVRIRLQPESGIFPHDVIFTYISATEWKLESMEMYDKSVDGI